MGSYRDSRSSANVSLQLHRPDLPSLSGARVSILDMTPSGSPCPSDAAHFPRSNTFPRWAVVGSLLGALLGSFTSARAAGPANPAPRLIEWERGFGLQVPGEPSAAMFLWVYEWNMFEAMAAGQHTHGTYRLPRRHNPDGTEAHVESPALQLSLRAVTDGAELTLRVTNQTGHAWPDVAGIIPCWNPGQAPGTHPSMPAPLNDNFADPWRRRSYYLSAGGLAPLDSRALHFHKRHRAAAEQRADQGRFAFSHKWPTAGDDAVAGLLVRESEDGRWVTGIAWEDVLSVQGHNPWSCLHACVRVGPLAPGATRTVRGRLYLLRGGREDCLERFRRDFSTDRQPVQP